MSKIAKYVLFYISLILVLIPFVLYLMIHRCDSNSETNFTIAILIIHYVGHYLFSRLLFKSKYFLSFKISIITFIISYGYIYIATNIEILTALSLLNYVIFIFLNVLSWEIQIKNEIIIK